MLQIDGHLSLDQPVYMGYICILWKGVSTVTIYFTTDLKLTSGISLYIQENYQFSSWLESLRLSSFYGDTQAIAGRRSREIVVAGEKKKGKLPVTFSKLFFECSWNFSLKKHP